MSGSARVLGPLLLALALVVAGCGAGTSGPNASGQAEVSPAPSLDVIDAGVCEATVMMEDGLTRVKEIRVRRNTRGRLEQALQSVLTGQDALLQRAPYQMRTRLRTLGLAVTNLTLAVEDVRTTGRIDVAAGNVRRSATALGKAINSFQRYVGCAARGPDDAEASPDGEASPAAEASPVPSVEG